MAKGIIESFLIYAKLKKKSEVLSRRELDKQEILKYVQAQFPPECTEEYTARWTRILDHLYALEDSSVDQRRKKPKNVPDGFETTDYKIVIKHGWGSSFGRENIYSLRSSFHYVNEEGAPSTNVIALDASLCIALTAKTGKRGRHWVSVLGINISENGEIIEVDQIQGAEKIKLAGYKMHIPTERSPEVFGKKSPEHVLNLLLIDFAKSIGAKQIRIRDPRHNKWGAVYDESRARGVNIYEQILHDVYGIRGLQPEDTKNDRPEFHVYEVSK